MYVATKTQRFVETGRRRIVRAQADGVESPAGGLNDAFHQLPANAPSAEWRQDVQVTNPADALIAGVGVDVEAAHSDQASIDEGAEQDLAWPVEPIHPAGPLFGQPTDEAQSESFTLDDQLTDRGRGELVQRFDHDEAGVGHSPFRS